MRAWAKRTLVAAALAAMTGGATADIAPGGEIWWRVMDIKLRVQELQLKAADAAAKTEDSHARAILVGVVAKGEDLFKRCEEMLDPR